MCVCVFMCMCVCVRACLLAKCDAFLEQVLAALDSALRYQSASFCVCVCVRLSACSYLCVRVFMRVFILVLVHACALTHALDPFYSSSDDGVRAQVSARFPP